ncbi:DUF4132 domain-containing protein [Nocardia sp. AG03]|uniref:DUF4132 domain-containing protein n=1 Tax=Nocardia sp. AG03 TaxID=3025312 RepID=UPI0024184D19|nr:DUF4132 domain-containing protein [Nocardia sp. AG03]
MVENERWPVPAEYVGIVDEERRALGELVERARQRADDPAELRRIADQALTRLAEGEDRALGHLESNVGDLVAVLDEIYDAAFPADDPDDVACLLAAPWPSAHRKALLARYLGVDVRHRLLLDEVAGRAVAAGEVALLRLLVVTPLGWLDRTSVAGILDALYRADALDAAVVVRAFTDDRYLGYAIVGRDGSGEVTGAPLACADAVRALVDEHTWRLVSGPEPVEWDRVPAGFAPRGLRFVRLALRWTDESRAAEHFGAAELTEAERAELVEELRSRPLAEQRRVFSWRKPAGDAHVLLPLFGLGHGADLLRMIRAIPTDEVVRQDRAALLRAIEQTGDEDARRVLALEPNELVSAVLGDNRAKVLKRVKNNALHGIAAFGMLPLEAGETVLDRYLAIRECGRRGAKLGPNRRISHAAAVAVALDHLAQVAGVDGPDRVEWDCEARIATATRTEATIGDYHVALRITGSEADLVVDRAGKVLKSVPSAVRGDPAYQELREHQERLRDQARRMRSGLVERLVATAGTLTPPELTRLLSLPAGAAMLPALLWRDSTDAIGLLDQLDRTGPVTAVHPLELDQRGTLVRWRDELAERGVAQPVDQVQRSFFRATPDELAGQVVRRYVGQAVQGQRAVPMLSARGWSTHGRYSDHQATKPVGDGLTAALRCEFSGYFGQAEVEIGELRFLRDGVPVPLTRVPPIVFSEAARDLDEIVASGGETTGT